MSLPITMPPDEILEAEALPPRPMVVAAAHPRSRPKASLPSRIAVIGNYLPRQCGIATFTTDLCSAISAEYGTTGLLALPVNDTESGYDYPARVRWSLAQNDVTSYEDAARFLNFNNIDMVCLQHEYGIFGGPAGSHILHLLRGLKMPVVTTLHTVLREPDANQMGVASQVIFHNRFVSPQEMVEFIGAADIYITPYRHEAQVVSGTLAYALGAGKAIISTPYWHAIELLDDRSGALVPFQNPVAIAQKTIELLDIPAIRHAMRKRAYLFARDMVWKKVAQGYMESFTRVRSDRMENPRVQFSARATPKAIDQLPELKLNHVHALTDDTGILQHAIFSIPNRAEGYTTDDNARALIFTVLLNQLGTEQTSGFGREGANPDWAFRYLAFLEHAFHPPKKRFRNFLGYDRRWTEEQGSEDSHGRALWALGTVLGQSANHGLRGAAGRLFEYSLPAVVEFHSPRACAYTVLGIQEYLHSYPGDRDAQRVRFALAQRLLDMYESIQRPDWKWFEDVVAYGNARLPQAMLLVGSACGNERMLSARLDSLDWLLETQRCPTNGHFVPIGSQGFYRQGGERARFDQQPVEAAGSVSACLQAYRVTGDHRWRDAAWSPFNWFLGDNDLQLSLYDSETGGCRDGLHPDRANQNQGAESTLSFLMALLEMRSLQNPERLPERLEDPS